MAPSYFFKETFIGLKRNGLVAFAAISTVFIALFLLGGALLVGKEVGKLIDQTEANIEVAVFLRDDISPSQQQHLADKIEAMSEVESVHYESKAEAYDRFKHLFADQEELVRNTSKDAIPASFRVKLKSPQEFEVVAARLVGEPGIEKIVDNRKVLSRLFAVTKVFRVGVAVIALIMLVSAGALIGNTVRMALFARRKEIGIMRLVGATNWFIRLPFLIEGMIEALIGTATAIAALFIMKVAFIDPLRGKVNFLPLIRSHDILVIIPWLVLCGVAVSLIAGFVAMLRFLEV